jgi:hypothetical protein
VPWGNRGAIDDDALDRMTRSLDRATEAGQWTVAEAIIRQIERLEMARAGNVVRIEAQRSRAAEFGG